MSMLLSVIKRDGTVVPFQASKIYNVMQKSVLETEKEGYLVGEALTAFEQDSHAFIVNLVEAVHQRLFELNQETVAVEQIQDLVQSVLTSTCETAGERFKLVRDERRRARQKREELFKTIDNITRVTDRENANVGHGPSSKLLQIAEAAARTKAEFGIPEAILKAMMRMEMYPHDFAWSAVGTTTCLQIPLRQVLKDGFYVEGKFIREPKRITSAAELACIIVQSDQNDQHGGQSFGWFDRDLAPYVCKEYEYQLQEAMRDALEDEIVLSTDKLEAKAWRKTVKETKRAMKAVVYNLNTMHARAGAQVPFSSVNIGTDTSREGQLITECLLEAYDAGLGKGEQPLFPNIIFKVKKGVNLEPGTPNHHLLWKSLEVSSNRLYPIYNFQDCTLNAEYEEDIPAMGCRTRVATNIHSDAQHPEGRGNLSFTTLNLPGIALDQRAALDLNDEKILAKYHQLVTHYELSMEEFSENIRIARFFVRLDELIELTIEQLMYRYKQQCLFRKRDFSFLMSGLWLDSGDLSANDTLESVLKHGTLSIGFIGLAETLTALIGQHHGESKEALALGYEIVSFMRKKADEATEIHLLNFSLIATPAEGLTGKLLRHDRAKYGIVEGVTDKDWYTNSCHVPVEYVLPYREKLEIEGKFVHLCNGGTITYIELTEAPKHNPKAMYRLLMMMVESDIALGAVNFPSDRCIHCGHHGVIETENCPACGESEVERIARITGYLAPVNNFNAAKKAEYQHRVKHDNC